MWVKLDDSMPDDPDVDRLSDGAFRLYVSGICHCAKHLTDGLIDAERVPRLIRKFRPTYAAELVAAGLWQVVPDGGYVVRSYTKYNRSRDWWTKKREADAKRLADWRAKNNAE